MSPRFFKLFSIGCLVVAGLIMVAKNVEIPFIDRIVKPTVECQDSPKCRAFIDAEIRKLIGQQRAKERKHRRHVSGINGGNGPSRGGGSSSGSPPSSPPGGGSNGEPPAPSTPPPNGGPGPSPSPPPSPPPAPPPEPPPPPPPPPKPRLCVPVVHRCVSVPQLPAPLGF